MARNNSSTPSRYYRNRRFRDFRLTKEDKFVSEHETTAHKLGLRRSYWLEALDPLHRPVEFLTQQYHIWQSHKIDQPFFDWLGNKFPRNNPFIRVLYLAPSQAARHYKLTFNKNKLYQNAKPFDTSAFKGKKPGYAAYVISLDNNFYAGEYRKNYIHHSTFVNGKQVLGAGMIKVKAGKILDINNYSGHYHANLFFLYNTIRKIPEEAFASGATITYQWLLFPKLIKWLTNSSSKLLRLLGYGLNTCIFSKKLSRKAFIDYAEKQLCIQHSNGLAIKTIQPVKLPPTNVAKLLATVKPQRQQRNIDKTQISANKQQYQRYQKTYNNLSQSNMTISLKRKKTRVTGTDTANIKPANQKSQQAHPCKAENRHVPIKLFKGVPVKNNSINKSNPLYSLTIGSRDTS